MEVPLTTPCPATPLAARTVPQRTKSRPCPSCYGPRTNRAGHTLARARSNSNGMFQVTVTCEVTVTYLQLHTLQHLSQRGQFLSGQGHAFAHLAMVRGPVPQVILRLALVPRDQVQFLLPPARRSGQYADGLDDFVLDFVHRGSIPVR